MMNDLHNAYNNLKNHEIRISSTLQWQWWFLWYLRVMIQNRWSTMLGKVLRTLTSAQTCSNRENLWNAIVESKKNSGDLWSFLMPNAKTVEEGDECRRQQKEPHELMKNWRSFAQFCSWMFLSFWRIWRENWLQFLVICDCDQEFVMIRIKYFPLIKL